MKNENKPIAITITSNERGFFNNLRVFDHKDNLLKNWTGLATLGFCMYDDNDGYQEWNVTDTPDRDKANGYRVRECYVAVIVVPKGYWNCAGCEMDYDAGSLGDDSKCPVCNITCDMVLVEDHPTMALPESKEVESVPVKSAEEIIISKLGNPIDAGHYDDIIDAMETYAADKQSRIDELEYKLTKLQVTNPIEVIKKRVEELQEEHDSSTHDSIKAELKIEIGALTYILKQLK